MTPNNSRVPAELFEECHQRLVAGESIAACLQRYPAYVAHLQSQLQVIVSLRQTRRKPSRNLIVAGHARYQFVEAAMQMASSPARIGWSNRLGVAWDNLLHGFSQAFSGIRPIPAGLVLTLTVVFLLGLLTTGTVTVAATAVPGQFLYPVKLAAEQTRLRLALDPTTHRAVAAQIDENRRAEARQILAQRLRVDRVAFAGVVESMRAGEWTISGLLVLITDESVIDGAVNVGDYVRGELQAPGNGTLVALKLEVDNVDRADKSRQAGSAPLPQKGVAVSATAGAFTPTPPPSAVPPTLAPPLAIPTVSIIAGEEGLTPDPMAHPLKTATPTSTRRPTLTPRPSLTPSPSLTPLRTVTHARIVDVVREMNGSRWTIGSWVVETNAETKFISSPGLGDRVDASLAMMPDGSTLALTIQALRDPPREKFDTTGVVNGIGPTSWDVDGTVFTIGGDTQIDSGIQLYDYANVQAERRANGENHALHIIRLVEDTTQFSGPIESWNPWVVMGHAVNTDAKTVYSGGPPAVGRIADVEALVMPGYLVARLIYVHIDTPTPTPTNIPVEPSPTATSTPPPTPTPPKPTRTPTPLPTRDVSALPGIETDGGRV